MSGEKNNPHEFKLLQFPLIKIGLKKKKFLSNSDLFVSKLKLYILTVK
jgi:hypothetical protein